MYLSHIQRKIRRVEKRAGGATQTTRIQEIHVRQVEPISKENVYSPRCDGKLFWMIWLGIEVNMHTT